MLRYTHGSMIKTLHSNTVYKNKWITVKEDAVMFSDGSEGIYGVVEKPDYSLVIPFFDGGFQLVKQYRYTVKGSFWEFPQGSYESSPEIPAVEVARGELSEETGLQAAELEEIGYQYPAYGCLDQGFHIFLASDVTQGEQQLEVSEQDMETAFFSVEEFEQMVDRGEIMDAPTISAYALLKMKGMV